MIPEAPRRGILGLECEYVVLWIGDDPSPAAPRPDFSEIEEVVFEILRSSHKTAPSSLSKRGWFLDNGGLVHLEIFLREQSDTPVLEIATPECRDAADLAVWSRAFDEILTDASRESSGRFAERGFSGYVAFGKSNRDSRGAGLGTHENYLVHERASLPARVAFFASVPMLLLLVTPALVVYVVALVGLVTGWLILRMLGRASRTFHSAVVWGFDAIRRRPRLWQNAIAALHITSNLLLFPAIFGYSRVLRALVFRRFFRDLTGFLVTRQVICGTGHLDFAAGAYEISQRSGMVGSFASIVIFGQRKTIYDLKGFLYRVGSILDSTKKLVITCGDSTLAEVPTFLRSALTVLLIEMIESGERFPETRLRGPLRALRRVSRRGPWARVKVARDQEMSALSIQRAYLRRAREWLAQREDRRARHGEAVDLWEETLDRLDDDPESAADRVEWIAKRQLLRGAVEPHGTWAELLDWGALFHAAGDRATREAASPEDLPGLVGVWRRSRVAARAARVDGGAEELTAWRELYFQLRKIDLRFHELNPLGGYARTLEAEGLLERRTRDEEVELAKHLAPPGTRARIRAHFIRRAPSSDHITASWHEVELRSPYRHVSLADPFDDRLPGET